MLLRLHKHVGTAGLIVAIVALVAALGGGAYAASGGLNSKQKKEVKTIAKGFQGTGPAGAPGAAGKDGAAGPVGKDGATGKDGAAGAAGAPGSSVTTTSATLAECPSGGVKVNSASGATKVCNGSNGTTGFTETLPSEATEKGAWSFVSNGETEQFEAISFPIPLSDADIEDIVVERLSAGATPTANCAGSAEDPQAVPGVLCVYVSAFGSNSGGAPNNAYKPAVTEEEGVISSGTLLYFENVNADKTLMGSFAITAP